MSSKINPPSSGGENDAFIVYDSRPGVPRTGILDFSWMNDAPAGSHGAVLVRNGGFVFEDGREITAPCGAEFERAWNVIENL